LSEKIQTKSETFSTNESCSPSLLATEISLDSAADQWITQKNHSTRSISTPLKLPIFKKKKALYGLNVAAIRTMGFANIVEGNPDVCMCDQNGYPNTVAPLGTALTPYHIEILRKYCPTAILYSTVTRLVTMHHSNQSDSCTTPGWAEAIITMPEGHDPDSYIREGNDFGAMFADAMPTAPTLPKNFPD